MKLDRLYLKNFRCFETLEVDFDERLTVIVADNGIGKTALLDAIALGFGRFLTRLPGIKGIAPKATDIRISADERAEAVMLLGWVARTERETQLVWASNRKRDGSVAAHKHLSPNELVLGAYANRGNQLIDSFASQLVEAESQQRPYFLPVVAYYGTNRAIREEVQSRRGFKKKFSRFDALAGALEPDSRFRAAFEWFTAMEDEERREQQARRDFTYRHRVLDFVREAIERMLPGYANPRTEIRPLRFVLDQNPPDGHKRILRVSQLSDGYKVVLGLTMDLARRMAQANGQHVPDSMQGTSPLDLPAIVLIDEVDLHLHPSWQQRILPQLLETFPKTQFIVTTHSPQVLSTVKREQIRVIGLNGVGQISVAPPMAMTYGEPSGDVMHSVMAVNPQPPVPEKDDLEQLTSWVDQGNYQTPEVIQLMQSLETRLGSQHPQLQRIRRSIRRQEVLGR
jgi:predicted ATP-binding protein involved in virulence